VVLEHNKHSLVESVDWKRAAVAVNSKQTSSFAEQALPISNAASKGCLIYKQFILK
jgi:hypothetical protein